MGVPLKLQNTVSKVRSTFFQTIDENLLFILFYFFIYFYQLEANYFTILEWVLPYIDMNQPWITCIPHPDRSSRSLWVFPVHQARALVSCIQPGLVICFTLDNIHVSMLFSQNIPPSPSPTESKSLFCTSVSLFLFCIQGIVTIFLNSIYMCQYEVVFFIFLAYFTLYNGLQFHPSRQN